MWFKVKMTTKALPVLQKMFPQSTLDCTTCAFNQLSHLVSHPGTAKPPLPTPHTPPCLCLFIWGWGLFAFKQSALTDFQKIISWASPPPLRLFYKLLLPHHHLACAQKAERVSEISVLPYISPWSNIFQEVVDLACRIWKPRSTTSLDGW